MENAPYPPEWGNDCLSEFLQAMHENTFCRFVHDKQLFTRLGEIAEAYGPVISHLSGASDWFAALFIPRAHSAWLAGVRLALGGQPPEAYAVLRACLENSLYCFYLSGNSERAETFLRKHDDDAWFRKMRNEFRPSRFLNLLRQTNERAARVASVLYQRTIDYGAHPNPRALLTSMCMSDVNGRRHVDVGYTALDPAALALCFTTGAQIGISSLDIIAIAEPNLFQDAGFGERLDKLRQGL